MNLTSEEIQSILDGCSKGSLEKAIFIHSREGECRVKHLREILTLRQEVDRLREQVPVALKAFTVVSHQCSHEKTSTVIANNQRQACDLAGGKIMDVCLGLEIEPKVLSSTSWNIRSMPGMSQHKEPTDRAVAALTIKPPKGEGE